MIDCHCCVVTRLLARDPSRALFFSALHLYNHNRLTNKQRIMGADSLKQRCTECVKNCCAAVAKNVGTLQQPRGGWILRCPPWKLLLVLFLLHATFQKLVNHRPLTCPHHHHHHSDVRVVRMTTTQEEAIVAADSTTHEEHIHASSDILYSVAEEEALDVLTTTNDEHLVEERVKYATFGGPLYGYALSVHANYHLVDQYSISHVSHGVIVALLVHLLASAALRRNRRFLCAFLFKYGFVIAVSEGVLWEMAENWPANVNCFDSKGIKFCGDSM